MDRGGNTDKNPGRRMKDGCKGSMRKYLIYFASGGAALALILLMVVPYFAVHFFLLNDQGSKACPPKPWRRRVKEKKVRKRDPGARPGESQ
jgi:hypothetical protein